MGDSGGHSDDPQCTGFELQVSQVRPSPFRSVILPGFDVFLLGIGQIVSQT